MGTLVSLLPLLAAGCVDALPGKPNPQDRPVPENQVLDFAALYRRNCSGCHGADGKLGPAPPLNDPIFLAIVPESELLRVVRDGRHATPMPGFGQSAGGRLTAPQVQVLAEGIQKQWKAADDAEHALPGYLWTAENVPLGDTTAGAQLYTRNFAECHGELADVDRRNDANVGAVADPDFLALISNQALRRIIITGRPDLGMPSYADASGRPDNFAPLTSAEIDAIVALLAALRDRTSGNLELNQP